MRHATFRTAAVPFLTVLILLLGGCAGDEGPEQVAAVLPLTGPSAAYGESVERGLTLARDQLAAEGTAPFEIEVHDSAGDPEQAAELLRAAYREGAAAAVGGITDSEARAMLPVVRKTETTLISPSALSGDLAAESRHLFRLSPTAFQEANKMGSFAALELDLREVAVLVPATDTGRSLAETFRTELERNEGKVVAEVSYPPGAEDVGSHVDELLAEDPPAVYIASAEAEETARALLSELAARGYDGTVMSTSAFAAPGVLEETGAAAEGLVLSASSFDPESEEPAVRRFVDAYREAHGEDPDLFAARGYDAGLALAWVLDPEQGGGSVRAREVWKGLRGIDGLQGATGHIQFDEQGNVGQFPRVYVVERGELDPLEADGAPERIARLTRDRAPSDPTASG